MAVAEADEDEEAEDLRALRNRQSAVLWVEFLPCWSHLKFLGFDERPDDDADDDDDDDDDEEEDADDCEERGLPAIGWC